MSHDMDLCVGPERIGVWVRDVDGFPHGKIFFHTVMKGIFEHGMQQGLSRVAYVDLCGPELGACFVQSGEVGEM